MIDQLRKDFVNRFNQQPLLVRSPGRINLLGEHTDYNEGFVLPAAINQAAFVAAQKRSDDRICLYAAGFNESIETDLYSLRPLRHWPDYVLGVVDQLLKRGYPAGGFNLVVDGDVPAGAGLSSSAAVECAVAMALNVLFELHIEKIELARIAQKAEHEFAGVLCGIMDQFASLFGKKNHVLRLDCRSLEYSYYPFQFDNVEIVLFNSGVKHSLASSEYNKRRTECEEGVRLISGIFPHVKSLRDATPEMVNACLTTEPVLYKRCLYVTEENQRVMKACDDLEKADVAAFGKKMMETHNGLSKQYEVSCAELDFLVEQALNKTGVLGARMMGGGFGGCTINLIEAGRVEHVVKNVAEAYRQRFGSTPAVYRVTPENGTSVLH